MCMPRSGKTPRLMLLVYFLVTSLIPLSNIHIEDMSGRSSFISSPGNYSYDFHIVLHEAILSHIGNKSEHLSTTAQLQKLSSRQGLLNTSKKRTGLYAVITSPVACD